jgi:hypothetical protein
VLLRASGVSSQHANEASLKACWKGEQGKSNTLVRASLGELPKKAGRSLTLIREPERQHASKSVVGGTARKGRQESDSDKRVGYGRTRWKRREDRMEVSEAQ